MENPTTVKSIAGMTKGADDTTPKSPSGAKGEVSTLDFIAGGRRYRRKHRGKHSVKQSLSPAVNFPPFNLPFPILEASFQFHEQCLRTGKNPSFAVLHLALDPHLPLLPLDEPRPAQHQSRRGDGATVRDVQPRRHGLGVLVERH